MSVDDAMPSRRRVLTGGAALGVSALILPRTAAHASSVPVAAAESGDGSPEQPYLLTTYSDLEWLSDLYSDATPAPASGLHLRLLGNITIPPDADPFTPIEAFDGTFDGGGFTITGLTVSVAGSTASVGMFTLLETSSTVRDLTLADVSISGSHEVGALAGGTQSGTPVTIERVHIRGGTVTSTRTGVLAADTGGLVGYARAGSSITGCSSTARVIATGRNVGGLVGDLRGTTLSRSWCTGPVGPPDGVATVDAGYGGLVGLQSSIDAVIVECFARGTVTATSPGAERGNRDGIGGLVGGAVTNAPITRCFATGSVSQTQGGTATMGGLVAVGSPAVTASYWDTETTGQPSSVGGTGAIGRSTLQMKDAATFGAWDLNDVWELDPARNDGYPSLRANPTPS
jgi:hypothetical protein